MDASKADQSQPYSPAAAAHILSPSSSSAPQSAINMAKSAGQQPTRRPSLLPAFEPVSSSPVALSKKRKFIEDSAALVRSYPTPVPTSSTGILPSSPRRPGLNRTLSTCSERAPLSDVPTVAIPSNGEQFLFGRSSNSCHHQLPYNRLISRVHVAVAYVPPAENDTSGQVRIECLGWNGCKVHYQGRVYELAKDDVYLTTQPVAEIILDIQDTRVILAWPTDIGDGSGRSNSVHSDSTWAENSPTRRLVNIPGDTFASSPPLAPRSPVSPSPARHISRALFPSSTNLESNAVQIYEDPASDNASESAAQNDENQPPVHDHDEKNTESSFSSVPDDFSDNENEENDPIVHSFGPFGSNLLSRLTSFAHTSPESKRRKVLKETSPSPKPLVESSSRNLSPLHQGFSVPAIPQQRKLPRESPIKNHVINQLAFSRVHAIPASAILRNLPADLKAIPTPSPSASPSKRAFDLSPLSANELRDMMHAIPCIGEIAREGKDAAGKALENEFYYVPERDENEMRRDAVVNGMGGTGLRNVRKSHKQYYWKKPR